MINTEAVHLWDAVKERVIAGDLKPQTLSALPLWLKSPLFKEWRFAEAEAVFTSDYLIRNGWSLVSAFVDLARLDRPRALRLLEKLAQSGSMSAHVGIQMDAVDLLRDSVRGDEDEQHLARSINSILVNNGQPDLLRWC